MHLYLLLLVFLFMVIMADAIGDKVIEMVQKQREEYMKAYEQHMFDLLTQIHELQDKLTIMNNDTTKEDRIKLLNLQQQVFERELLDLNQTNEQLTKRLQYHRSQRQEQGGIVI